MMAFFQAFYFYTFHKCPHLSIAFFNMKSIEHDYTFVLSLLLVIVMNEHQLSMGFFDCKNLLSNAFSIRFSISLQTTMTLKFTFDTCNTLESRLAFSIFKSFLSRMKPFLPPWSFKMQFIKPFSIGHIQFCLFVQMFIPCINGSKNIKSNGDKEC